NGREQARLPCRNPLDIAYSRAGKHLVCGTGSGQILVWDTVERKEMTSFKCPASPICGLMFSGDGTKLACIARDGSARCWDASTGQQLMCYGEDIGSFPFDEMKPVITFVDRDNRIRITGQPHITSKDARSGEEPALFREVTVPQGKAIHRSAIESAGTLAAFGAHG